MVDGQISTHRGNSGEFQVANKQVDQDGACQTFVDFDGELSFWRDGFQNYQFFRPGFHFGDYEPAIKLGIDVFLHSHGRSFDEMKDQLGESYERTRGSAPLDWSEASAAACAAWERMRGRNERRA